MFIVFGSFWFVVLMIIVFSLSNSKQLSKEEREAKSDWWIYAIGLIVMPIFTIPYIIYKIIKK